MGGKGSTAPPPLPAAPIDQGIDPVMMQLMASMMSQPQPQMPQMPQIAPVPEVETPEPVDWQSAMEDLRTQARADYNASDRREAQLIEAFYPGASDRLDSLLTEDTEGTNTYA